MTRKDTRLADGVVAQQLLYTTDCAGRIVRIEDLTGQDICFRPQVYTPFEIDGLLEWHKYMNLRKASAEDEDRCHVKAMAFEMSCTKTRMIGRIKLIPTTMTQAALKEQLRDRP